MKLLRLSVAGLLAAILAVPAMAQTMQSTPQKPTPSITTNPGTPTTSPSSRSTASPSTQGLVDINSASPAELDALPGIGKARADAIVKNRPYNGKDDLLSRHIVPPNVYNGIKDKIVARRG